MLGTKTESDPSDSESGSRATECADARIHPSGYYEPGGVPVFRPTYAEFKDFATFVQAIEPYGKKAGLVKVIPPKEWTDMVPTSVDRIKKLVIKRSITQEFNWFFFPYISGGLPSGVHRAFNIENKKSYTVQEWYDMAQSDKFRQPVLVDVETGKMSLASLKRKMHEDETHKIQHSLQTTTESETTITAFTVFCKVHRAMMKQLYPESPTAEVTFLLKKEFEKLSTEDIAVPL